METITLEKLINDFLKERQLTLAELKWIQEGRSHILQVAISFDDGTMDLDTCTEVSQALSPILDTVKLPYDSYMLEVCSPGAERVLDGPQAIQQAVGKLVKIQFLHPIQKSLEWTGTLNAFDGEKGVLQVRIKTTLKTLEFDASNIVKIRLAVM